MHKLKALLFSPLLLLLLVIVLSFSLKVNVVECNVGENNCSPEIYQKLEAFKGKSIFFVNIDKILSSSEFQSEVILLEHYQKKMPGTLILNFSEENILYQLNLEQSFLYISEFGNILQTNQGKDQITQVYLYGDIGEFIESRSINREKHLIITSIINQLEKDELSVDVINWVDDTEIIIKVKDEPQIVIDNSNVESKINNIKLILGAKEIKDYDKPIEEIDLRFNLPVLRTSE